MRSSSVNGRGNPSTRPQGLDSGTEAGTDYGWPNTGGQDINFVKAMITWLESSLFVDKSRIFSDGMIYGGMMSETIACQLPELFRAIGSMSGSMFGSTRSCVGKPIAAWITQGDAAEKARMRSGGTHSAAAPSLQPPSRYSTRSAAAV
jgi:poly(3-hydroxybutyrate) depolymerase